MAPSSTDGTPANEPPPGTQAIGRALTTLKLLAGQETELSVSRIATELELSPGTANRIVRALVAGGLVTHNALTDGYYLGTGAVLLGQAAQRGFGLDRALPVLEQINAETQESVNLAVRESGESVVMLRAQSTLPLRFEQQTGARFPLYTTASGKAILAHSADAEHYLASLPERLPQLTAHTLDTPARVAAQLEQVRRRGYSIDEEENVAGVRCVGAPVLDSDGRAHAAVVIQVPTVRMPRARVRELGVRAVTGAKEIAQFVPINRVMSR
ncbi:IclR family transcriptional regulator [Amycolatopsis antarctica]|uniref:IclR family transcriptional regulator n=1 Tax=Amycolatopsis antarctica TaxID=1854586 RepID=A0A263D2M5_9PSEU|nr:IclR family transcriptional regulator [Amycolatopsis antarctica]OZM71605.1 IclR family transcriptional regulator [Amycolatopsis antarctica]